MKQSKNYHYCQIGTLSPAHLQLFEGMLRQIPIFGLDSLETYIHTVTSTTKICLPLAL